MAKARGKTPEVEFSVHDGLPSYHHMPVSSFLAQNPLARIHELGPLQQLLERKGSAFVLAHKDGKVIGISALYADKAGGEGEILSSDVTERERGKKTGLRMLLRTLEWFKANGITSVSSTMNSPADDRLIRSKSRLGITFGRTIAAEHERVDFEHDLSTDELIARIRKKISSTK